MKHYDLIVVGGGLSGVAAAVSAARRGLKVLIADKAGWLGGAMSNCLIYPFMPYHMKDKDGNSVDLSTGFFKELTTRAAKDLPPNTKPNYYDSEYFKFLLDDVVAEAGVEVLFHVTLFRVETEGREIKNLLFAAKSGVLEYSADFYIDATGDGDLFYFAGCDFQLGRDADNLCQPMTTCFRIANVDRAKFEEELPTMQALYKQFRKEGKIINERENILVFRHGMPDGVLHFNTTRVIKHNPTDPEDVSRAEVLARKQVKEMVEFLKANLESCKNATLIACAADIGVRESRKLRGVHILNQDELIACTKFEDSIALGNYDIDIHNPAGADTSHYYFGPGEYYTIPYRSLLPKEYDNLLVAGRCISATHEAQASVRIMPICCCMGEAAGTAAAIIKETGTTAHSVDVSLIQDALRKNGASID